MIPVLVLFGMSLIALLLFYCLLIYVRNDFRGDAYAWSFIVGFGVITVLTIVAFNFLRSASACP